MLEGRAVVPAQATGVAPASRSFSRSARRPAIDKTLLKTSGATNALTTTQGLTTVLLWILSDVHLELTRGWDLPVGAARPDCDVMIVAGDLVTRMERGVRWLMERVTDRPVIYIAGNHEAYGVDIDITVEKARAAAAGTNVQILQNEKIVMQSVTFLGATLWTDFCLFGDPEKGMAVARDRMNDYRKIRKSRYQERLRPADTLARHRESRAFFEAEMRNPRAGKMVIVSHHAPHHDLAEDEEDDVISVAYASDLAHMMVSGPAADGMGPLVPADVWIYGHTHEHRDIVIGATRVVTNSKGYGPWPPRETRWENPRFDPRFVIEI